METQIREHGINPAARSEADDATRQLNNAQAAYNALS
jgi:hypothetical protein